MSYISSRFLLLAPGCFSELPRDEQPPDDQPTDKAVVDINEARVSQTSTSCYEQALLQALDQSAESPGELPIAHTQYTLDNGTVAPEHCVCAEFVHLQPDTSNARLIPSAALKVTDSEAIGLLTSLNELLRDDGVTLERTEKGTFYLTGMPAAELDTWPAHALATGKVANYLPRRSAAGDWRRLITEIQMLFHSHSVNEARVANEQLPINAMWFWGGHHMKHRPIETPKLLIASDGFSCALASTLGLEVKEPGSYLQSGDWPNTEGDVIVVDLGVYNAWLRGDYDALVEAKNNLNTQWIEPAQRAVATGAFAEFVLDGCEGQAIAETMKPKVSGFDSVASGVKNFLSRFTSKAS